VSGQGVGGGREEARLSGLTESDVSLEIGGAKIQETPPIEFVRRIVFGDFSFLLSSAQFQK
jgi:hypothetical protein